MLDTMTKADLMKASNIRDGRNFGGYNLSAYYIRTHWREMGGYSKPLLFDRELVELHLLEKFWQDRLKAEAKTAKVTDMRAFVLQKVSEIQRASSLPGEVGKIMGKGVRGKFEGRSLKGETVGEASA